MLRVVLGVATMISLVIVGSAPAQALNGQWRITHIAGGAPLVAEKTDFTISPEGRLAASVGCNRMMGSVKVSGKTLAFSAIASTKMACADPDLNKNEQALAKALVSAASYRDLKAGKALVDASGRELLRLRPR